MTNVTWTEQAIKDLIATIDNHSEQQIVEAIKFLDNMYFNHNTSVVEDSVYDQLKELAIRLFPNNDDLQSVGSDIDVRDQYRTTLPVKAMSLDQIRDVEQWTSRLSLQDPTIVITEKVDGISVILEYRDGKFFRGYTRGDGFICQDITRHCVHVPSIPKTIDRSGIVYIRGEAVILYDKFDDIIELVGYPYRHRRNAVSGIFNTAECFSGDVYQSIIIVPYTVYDPLMSKSEQLKWLSDNQFEQIRQETTTIFQLTNNMCERLIERWDDQTKWEIDGIVIDIDSSSDRQSLDDGDRSANDKFAIKYKTINQQTFETTVQRVVWNVSRDHYAKPTVEIDPVNIDGVTVSRVTGHNAKFICDNQIDTGSKIAIVRSGGVIPTIVLCHRNDNFDLSRSLTNSGIDRWKWNDSHVEVVVLHQTESAAIRQIERTINIFDIDHLRRQTIKKLFSSGMTEAIDIFKNINQLEDILGANGQKIADSIKQKLNNVDVATVIAACPSMPRGISKKTIEQVIASIGYQQFIKGTVDLSSIDQIGPKTAKRIAAVIDDVNQWIEQIEQLDFASINYEANCATPSEMIDVVFTQFRDKELQQQCEQLGFVVKSSVTKSTKYVVAKDPSRSSSKITKAKANNIPVITIEEFKEIAFG